MITLQSALELYTKEDLKNYAKQLGIKRYSTMNKPELAGKVAEQLLDPSVMAQRMSIFTDAQISLLERAIKEAFQPTDEELEDANRLDVFDYAFIASDHNLVVADDVKAVYNTINTPEFHQHRKQLAWVLACINIANVFYGATPIDIMLQVCSSKTGFQITKEEFLKFFQEIPTDANPSSLVEDYIVAESMVADDQYKEIIEAQAGKTYYIPTEAQVEDFEKNGYLTDEQAFQDMFVFLQKEFDFSYAEAKEMTAIIWMKLAMGYFVNDVMEVLNEKKVSFTSEDSMKQFISLMQEANNHTRMLTNRGAMPIEVSADSKTEAVKDTEPKQTIKMISTGKTPMVTGKKIYPNDQCPCGSGKKYKKCCGKNK